MRYARVYNLRTQKNKNRSSRKRVRDGHLLNSRFSIEFPSRYVGVRFYRNRVWYLYKTFYDRFSIRVRSLVYEWTAHIEHFFTDLRFGIKYEKKKS